MPNDFINETIVSNGAGYSTLASKQFIPEQSEAITLKFFPTVVIPLDASQCTEKVLWENVLKC